MEQQINLLDPVALLRDIPEAGLRAGQVGAVVEVFGKGMFEVEFVDRLGRTVALLPIHQSNLLVLIYEKEMA